jgi:hypothetical protein
MTAFDFFNMKDPFQRWREEFKHDPDNSFNRLVCGYAPIGCSAILSFGEILDDLFESGDSMLDLTVSNWLESHILEIPPKNISTLRWGHILEEFFLGMASMKLPKVSEILFNRKDDILLWLSDYYEGPDRDPGGAYLITLKKINKWKNTISS